MPNDAKKDLVARLQELYLYRLYGFDRRLRPLSMVVNPDETVNSFSTGLHNGQRRMVAVTNYRIIIVAAPTLGTPEVTVISRNTVKSYTANKRLFGSSFSIQTQDGTDYTFTNVARGAMDLFSWAMEQPITQFDL